MALYALQGDYITSPSATHKILVCGSFSLWKDTRRPKKTSRCGLLSKRNLRHSSGLKRIPYELTEDSVVGQPGLPGKFWGASSHPMALSEGWPASLCRPLVFLFLSPFLDLSPSSAVESIGGSTGFEGRCERLQMTTTSTDNRNPTHRACSGTMDLSWLTVSSVRDITQMQRISLLN